MRLVTLPDLLWALLLRTSTSTGDGVGVFDVSQHLEFKGISH